MSAPPAEAQLTRLSLQFLDIADARFGEAVKTRKNAQSGRNVQTAYVSAGLCGEGDSLHRLSLTPNP